MNKLINFLDYGGLSETEYNSIVEYTITNNKNVLRTFVPVMLTVYGCLIALSKQLAFKKRTVTFIVFDLIMMAFLAAVLYSNLTKKKYIRKKLPYIFLFIVDLSLFAIAFDDPDRLVESYISISLLMPILFVDRPYRMFLVTVATVCFYVYFTFHLKTGAIAFAETKNMMMMLVISQFLGFYFVKHRLMFYLNQRMLSYIGEMDVLTGIKNRNCFEADVKKIALEKPNHLICLYVDVNGLHSLNNTQGHQAGDRMLVAVAEELRSCFGMDYTYRIGGDEFLCFIKTMPIEQVNEALKSCKDNLNKSGYHIAYGLAIGEGVIVVRRLVKSAELAMYKDKKQYYMNHSGLTQKERN